jgi:hypothetical protein
MNSWIRKIPRSKREYSCPSCGYAVSASIPSLDHHLHPCRRCGQLSFFWTADRDNIQICVDLAPVEVGSFLKWSSASLDELQFVELLCAIETAFFS